MPGPATGDPKPRCDREAQGSLRMSNGRVVRGKLVELAIVAITIGLLTCCLLPIVWDARGPAGQPIPNELPDESRRVHSPTGLSIVAPSHWVARTSGGLFLVPMSPGRYGRHSKALIVISDIGQRQPQDIQGMRVVRFLGQEAFERMGVVRNGGFDDPAWSEYILYARHGEQWYEVRYGIAEERTELPGMIRRFLNTLRWDDGHAGQQA